MPFNLTDSTVLHCNGSLCISGKCFTLEAYCLPIQVTSSGNTLHCLLPKLPTHPIGKLLQCIHQHCTMLFCVVCRALTTLLQVLPTCEARDVLLNHYRYSHAVSHDQQWPAFQLWLTTMLGISGYPSNNAQSTATDNTQVCEFSNLVGKYALWSNQYKFVIKKKLKTFKYFYIAEDLEVGHGTHEHAIMYWSIIKPSAKFKRESTFLVFLFYSILALQFCVFG